MSYRVNPAGKRQVTLGEDFVFETTLRDRSNELADLSGAGANLTVYAYDRGGDLLVITLSCDDPTTGELYGTIPAQALYDTLSPGLYRYQVKVAQNGSVLVAEQGTLNVLGGSLGPNPTEGAFGQWVALSLSGLGYALDDGIGGGTGTLAFDEDGALVGTSYAPAKGAVVSELVTSGWQITLTIPAHVRITVQAFSTADPPSAYTTVAAIHADSPTPLFTQDSAVSMSPSVATEAGLTEEVAYQNPEIFEGAVVASSFEILIEVYMVNGSPGTPP